MAEYVVISKDNGILDGQVSFDRLSAANQFFNSLLNVLRTLEDGGQLQLRSQPTNGSIRILKDTEV